MSQWAFYFGGIMEFWKPSEGMKKGEELKLYFPNEPVFPKYPLYWMNRPSVVSCSGDECPICELVGKPTQSQIFSAIITKRRSYKDIKNRAKFRRTYED
jgi:hypothetical protein